MPLLLDSATSLNLVRTTGVGGGMGVGGLTELDSFIAFKRLALPLENRTKSCYLNFFFLNPESKLM